MFLNVGVVILEPEGRAGALGFFNAFMDVEPILLKPLHSEQSEMKIADFEMKEVSINHESIFNMLIH